MARTLCPSNFDSIPPSFYAFGAAGGIGNEKINDFVHDPVNE